jgi:hypothetical protein
LFFECESDHTPEDLEAGMILATLSPEDVSLAPVAWQRKQRGHKRTLHEQGGESAVEDGGCGVKQDAGARTFVEAHSGKTGASAWEVVSALYHTALTSHSPYKATIDVAQYGTSGKYVLRKVAIAAVKQRVVCLTPGKRVKAYALDLAKMKVDSRHRAAEFRTKGEAATALVRDVLAIPAATVPKVAENSLTVDRAYSILQALYRVLGDAFEFPTL